MHKIPNAAEQLKHDRRPCSPEKIETIEDDLRFFGLIAEQSRCEAAKRLVKIDCSENSVILSRRAKKAR